MMKYFKLNKINFRHLVLGITLLAIVAFTLIVALISSQIAYNEMSESLHRQGTNFTQNLVKDSVAPLLYDSVSSAEDVLNTLMQLKPVTEVKINRASGENLAQANKPEHIEHKYLKVNVNEPFNVLETDEAWYFSALVLNEVGSGNIGDDFFEVDSSNSKVILGSIQLGLSKSGIVISRKNIFIRNFIVSSIVGLLLLYAMYIVLRNITRPLEKLSALMEQGRQGEYSDKAKVQGTKEISEITHVFNEMISAIKEREQNLSLTLDSIGDAVIVTDASGYVVRMNPVAEALTGWCLQDAKGLSVKKIFPIIDATTRVPIKSPVDKVLETGETIYLSNHTTLIAKDNTEYQIADSAAPIRNDANEILGMVLVFNDVTEQYQLREIASRSQRDMQQMMNNYPAIICIRDVGGHLKFVNQHFESLFNVQREEVMGKTLADVLPDEVACKMALNDEYVLNVQHSLQFEEEVEMDGQIRNYLSIRFPLFDDENKIYAICGISTDITEHKKQEEQLRRSQKMDALGKLTGGVAHDYNNMLGVVMGYAEILKNQLSENEKHKNYAQKILHAGERGAKLTKKLLAFSRKQKTLADAVNINALLLEERDMLEKVITARITLTLDLSDDLKMVHLDEGDLEDTIVNLCINAMHAIEESGQLTISTKNTVITDVDAKLLQLRAGGYVCLTVTDTGCGMDAQTKEKIFEPFYTTKGEMGTGLGLAQVYGFIERSGGAVQVYSEINQGTEFVIYFPSYEEDDNTASHENAPIDETKTGYESILIVDDEQPLLELTCEILNDQGYRTVCASNAEQAIELLKNQSFDLLLTDIIMPGMNGYQLASLVKKQYPEIKIKLASGFSDDRHAEMIDDELYLNIIQKPYQSSVLLKAVRDVLDEK